MNIVIISAVYSPEAIISALTSANITNKLREQKNIVQVITNFPNRPGGKIYPGYHKTLYKREINDIYHEILRCYSSFSTNSAVFSRLLENITFGLTSNLALLFSKKPQVIYTNTWPIFAQGLTTLAAKIRKIPIVLSIQDLYPESLEIQGRITKRNLIYKILRWIDQINAKWATELIVISERFAKVYIEDRKITADKIHVIPNWMDEKEIQSIPKDMAREKYKIPEGAFVMAYGGNIGSAAGVEQIIQAVGEQPDQSKAILLIAGEGSQLKYCQALAKQIGKNKVIFHSPWLAEETGSILSTADILVLPTQGNQSMVSVPSKIITYLFAGKPILAMVNRESDIAEIINKCWCGWVIEPDKPEKISQIIQHIQLLPKEELDHMGSAGREYAVEHNSSEKNVKLVIDVLEKVAKIK